MNSFKEVLNINVYIQDCSDSIKAIMVLRRHSKWPTGNLLKAIKNNSPVFTLQLLRKDFYSGWKDLYKLIEELEIHDLTFSIYVDNEKSGLAFIEELKTRVLNIKKEDIF